MGSQETRALSDTLLEEAARTGDLESTIRQRVTPDAVLHMPNGETGNIEFLAAFLQESATAFPDVTLSLDHSMVDGDRAIFQFTLEGTHLGTYRGFEPTGERFSTPVCWTLRFDGGRIAELWYYASVYDFLVPGDQRRRAESGR